MNQEANIDIVRKDRKLSSVSVVMPIWDKQVEEDVLVVQVPLLGITTYAKNEIDAETAIKEAIELFCLNAEKFGNGLESELRDFGWELINNDGNLTSMAFSTTNSVYDNIMKTGEQVAHTLELA